MAQVPTAKFRQFMIEVFGKDEEFYKSADIAEMLATSEDPDLAAMSTQRVGDILRAWARNKMIVQGWTCQEQQGKTRGHSRFRIHRVGSPPEQVTENHDRSATPTKKNFSGKIQSTKPDGSMLVINTDGAFIVRPVKW